MRLESYEKQVTPNTTAGGGLTDVGGQQAAASMSLPGSLEPLIKGIGDYKNYEIARIDKNINLAVTEATTDYMNQMTQALYDKDEGYLNKQYKGADGITNAFIEKEKQVRENIAKGLPQYEKAQQDLKAMADAFVMKALPTVEKHERGEFERNRDLQTDNYLKANRDLALASGTTEILEEAFRNMKNHIATTYEDREKDYILNRQNSEADTIAKTALQAKLEAGSIKGILDVAKVARANGVSESVIVPYEEKAKGIQLEEDIDKSAQDLYAKYQGNMEQAEAEYEKGLRQTTQGLDYKTMSATINSMKGTPYVWGGTSKDGVDCSGFTQLVYKSVGQDIPRTADMQLHWCETNNCLHTDKELKDIKQGDLVFYSGTDSNYPPTDDPNAGDGYAYKGVTHVGVYIGDGKVMQAGTTAGVSEMPVHTYDIVGYGSPGNRPLSEEDIKKRKELFAVKLDKVDRIHRQEVARKADAVEKAFNIYLADNPGTTPREQAAKLSSLIGNDMDLKGTFGSKVASLNQRAVAEEKARTAGNGGGGAVVRSGKQAILNLKGAIANGTIKTDGDLANYITSNELALDADQYTSIRNYLKNKTEGTGEFAYDWSVYKRMPEFKDVTSGDWEGAKEYAYSKINAYKNKTHEEPLEYQIIQWLKDALLARPLATSRGFWGQQVVRQVSPAALRSAGIYKAEKVRGADGNIYGKIYYSNRYGDWKTTTEEEYDEIMKGLER